MLPHMRIMTYNIHSGIGTDGVPDWKRISSVIASESPDAVGLEEVARYHTRTPELDLGAALAEELGMSLAFGDAIRIYSEHGRYGVAGLTKAPMEFVEKQHYPIPDGSEKRVFIVLKVLAERPYYLIVTHIPYKGEMAGDEEIRRSCVRQVTETVKAKGYFPAVLVGDLNCEPGDAPIGILREDWDVFNDAALEMKTCTTKRGWLHIDYICAFPKGTFSLKDIRTVEDVTASDHKPVVADLEWT